MTARVCGVWAALLGLMLPAAGAAFELQPHRAFYRLALARSGAEVGFADVRGALVIEWRAACDGWLSQQRLGFVVASEGGEPFSYDVRFSSWESRDRTRLRFSLRSFEGAQIFEEYRGEAALEAPGGGGRARFVRPEVRELALPAGTIFPTEQIARLIEDAQAGRRVARYLVFDGSGPHGLSAVSAAIGEVRQTLLGDGRSIRRWPVALAYFPPQAAADQPEFEIAFELDERGILYDVHLDYGSFALHGELDRLELLEPEPCR